MADETTTEAAATTTEATTDAAPATDAPTDTTATEAKTDTNETAEAKEEPKSEPKSEPQAMEVEAELKHAESTWTVPVWCRVTFEIILIWLALLMLTWDIAVPVGMYKTVNFVPSQNIANGCAVFQPEDEWNPDLLTEDNENDIRRFKDTVVWFNEFFRQSYGRYWTNLITVHVLMAWIVFPTFLFQMIRSTISSFVNPTKYTSSSDDAGDTYVNHYGCCLNGDKIHRYVGGVLLGLLAILWSCGGIAGAIIIFDRGFHPCSQTMSYTTCRTDTPPTATSFSFYLYLQFVYDGALISETLLHGVAARLFRAKGHVRKWHILIMNFLSISCIFLYVLRTGTMIGIVSAYHTNRNYFYRVRLGKTEAELHEITMEQRGYSGEAKKFGVDGCWKNKTLGIPRWTALENPAFLCMGENACATESNGLDAAPAFAVAEIMLVVYLMEILVIPWINIGNILFTNAVYRKIKEGKGELIRKAEADYSHGANLYACAFAVLWTFMANIGFVVADKTNVPSRGSAITFGAYGVLLIGLLLGWYIPVWRGTRPHSPNDVYYRCFRMIGCCKPTKIDEEVYGKDYFKDDKTI
mmetsp:Transcript_105807/g.129092  ORF Transcript_105807/g.129092 Transcript_105807/m.129092 type:complete len:581 (-) Transcript_105807:307-2049(-)